MTEQQAQEVSDEFELMDREDEAQILADLRGVPVDKFVYKNKRGEWELTFAGTKWVVRKMAELGEAIRMEGHPKVERCQIDPEYLTVTVLGKRIKVDREAKCETVLDMTVGSARQWIKQKINNGATIVPDEHFFTKCVSRATRNMQQAMIPYDFKKDMIQELVKMQGANGGARGQSQQRPPQNQGQPPAQEGGAPSGQQQKPPAQGQAAQKPQNQQPPAQGQAAQKPQGQAAQKPQGAGAQKPQGQAAQKPQGGGQKGQQKQDASSAPIETVQQNFNAVLQAAIGTNDAATLKRALKQLTGKENVTDLEREVMTELGPLLRRKAKGEVRWTGTALVENGENGAQLWPKPAPQSEPEPSLGGEESQQSDEVPLF